MNWREFLGESKTALLIAIAVVLCALSFGFGTNYAHSVTHTVTVDQTYTGQQIREYLQWRATQCNGEAIPNPCDPDSNN